MISFLKPADPAPPLPAGMVDADYKRLRLQVFLSIFIGYAGYYLVRKNLSLAIPDILKEHPEYTKAQLGAAMSALSIGYGVSKFIMGSVSDRSNPRTFMSLGLLLSSAVMAVFGLVDAVYASLTLMIVLQFINGWFNGMGWAPCGKTMVHWFSAKERGLTVSVWNVAHNVGGGAMAGIAYLGLTWTGDWGAKFYFNAGAASVIAFMIYVLLRDTPQSCGLPPVEDYKKDYPQGYSSEHERTFSFKEIFLEHVLPNKYLWAIAFANAFTYFVRYGVADWIPTYLQTGKGFLPKDTALAVSFFEYAGIPGTIVCGVISDRLFRGRRAPATIVFMLLTLLGVVAYSMNAKGPFWIDCSVLAVLGFLIYGPIMIIGLHALELVPKKAAGTAAGFTGFFGYVFGSAIAGTGVGWIADHWGWGGVFTTMGACCILAILFSSFTLGHRSVRADEA